MKGPNGPRLRAAALMGAAMARFVRGAVKKAFAVVDRDSRVTLSKRDFDAFSMALDGAFAPSCALEGALKQARAKVQRA